MSRAFVKEPDGGVHEPIPDRPLSDHPNYVSPAGLDALRAKLAELEGRRSQLTAEGAGDAADEAAVQEQMGYIDRDLRFYCARLESAIVVDPLTQPRDEVAFGAVVVARDQHGAEHRFIIVGEDEADVARDKVSWVSPVAEALLGARRGDEVVWRRPVGDLRLSVEAIDYPQT
jgi:transcription elongation GreA/GreB family factor